MTSEAPRFDPVKYKETTREQWQEAAGGGIVTLTIDVLRPGYLKYVEHDGLMLWTRTGTSYEAVS
jgi:hypothetical protein